MRLSKFRRYPVKVFVETKLGFVQIKSVQKKNSLSPLKVCAKIKLSFAQLKFVFKQNQSLSS